MWCLEVVQSLRTSFSSTIVGKFTSKGAIAIVKVWMIMMKERIFAGHPSLALAPLHLASLALALLALNLLAFALLKCQNAN